MPHLQQIRSALIVCIVLAIVFCLFPASNASSLPQHRISISFDLTKQRIYGTVDATIPKNVGTIVVGNHLRVSKLTVDGKIIRPRVTDGLINLPAHADRSRVHLVYQGIFAGKDLKIEDIVQIARHNEKVKPQTNNSFDTFQTIFLPSSKL